MLYRVIIENYKSFNKSAQFDMFPNMKRTTLEEHVYSHSCVPVLKASAVYGSNGAGKSNFIKAMLAVKSLAMGNLLASKEWYEKNHFLLKEEQDGSPISFILEFSKNATPYIYCIEIDGKGIKEEGLYVSGLGKSKNKTIFLRKYQEVDFVENKVVSEVASIIKRTLESNVYQCLLPFLASNHIIDNVNLTQAYEWFCHDLEVLTMNHDIPGLISLLYSNDELLDFVNDIFRQLSLGINKLDIKTETFDEWANNEGKSDLEMLKQSNLPFGKVGSLEASQNSTHIFSIANKDGQKMVQTFLFKQMGVNGFEKDMDVRTQSDGTLRLLTLLPAIYRIKNEESTLVIDEINNSIHPIIIRNLLAYFCGVESKGQLVFTTHETELLRQQTILRPDEIWFVDKTFGETSMYSLNDFKFHKTMSVINAYMDGRFHAVPADVAIV